MGSREVIPHRWRTNGAIPGSLQLSARRCFQDLMRKPRHSTLAEFRGQRWELEEAEVTGIWGQRGGHYTEKVWKICIRFPWIFKQKAVHPCSNEYAKQQAKEQPMGTVTWRTNWCLTGLEKTGVLTIGRAYWIARAFSTDARKAAWRNRVSGP